MNVETNEAPFKILGVSASLRNARRGLGNASLIADIMALGTQEKLFEYIEQEAALHLQNFMDAGRKERLPFDAMYLNLRKMKGHKGLSNSEVALVTALWSAFQLGATIDHVSLSEYFSETSTAKNIDELKAKMLEADGILLSGPVYFGDRGSLAQSFTNLIREDPALAKGLEGKVYAGIAVGAKRNGGQETTLIYQLLDMIACDFLGVGNDSETTSQYGGTGLAGDIGTMPKDRYGLDTSMGTGRRIARVVHMLKLAEHRRLKAKPHLMFWILQDRDSVALDCVHSLLAPYGDQIDASVFDISGKKIVRCLACDICPTHVDVDEEYRCIIKSGQDDMKEMHTEMLEADAIIPVAFSPRDRAGLRSNYQRFIERTRYFRRGDYVWSDLVSAPLVIEELGAVENMSIRMMTSMIRHHTIIRKPLNLYLQNGKELNRSDLVADFERLIGEVKRVTTARLLAYSSSVSTIKYNPVGYILSAAKDKEDETLQKRKGMLEGRVRKFDELLSRKVVAE